MKLRQIALVAENLAPVKQAFFDLLGLDDAFVDEGVGQFGLQNIVMRIGNTYLEVVSPVQEGTTAGRLLQRRGGDGGYMVIVQVDDLAAETARVERANIRIAWRADVGKAKVIHLHPRDVPGAIASLDEMTPPEAWYWAGAQWQDQPAARHVSSITAAQVQSADPGHTARQWSLAYNLPIETLDGVLTLRFEQGEVRFVEDCDSRGDGLQAVDIQATNLEAIHAAAERLSLPVSGNTVTVCGTRFNFCGDAKK